MIITLRFSETIAQSNTLRSRSIRQVISYYPNGNIKKIEAFLKDSCRLYNETLMDIAWADSCRCGSYKEYYPNGMIKTVGQYEGKFWKSKHILEQGYTYGFEEDSFKSGIWYRFDSLGRISRITKYFLGIELFHRNYPIKKDALIANKDINILTFTVSDVCEGGSYLISRANKDVKLFLKFPLLDDHNYWFIFAKPLDIIDDYSIYTQDYLEDVLLSMAVDDTTDDTQPYMNMSFLQDGRYYVYYKRVGIRYLYELEVILESVN